MTMGHRGTAPPAAPCHFGRGTGFVDEDQSLRLQVSSHNRLTWLLEMPLMPSRPR